MTAGHYHSLITFLHASDFEDEKINEEARKVREQIKVSDDEEQEIRAKWADKSSWVSNLPEKIKLAKEEVKKNKKDLVDNIISDMKKQKNEEWNDSVCKSFEDDIENKMDQYLEEVFEKSLENFNP